MHVKTIHDVISDGILPKSKPWKVEGMDTLKWVLIDFVDMVIHIFQKEQRDYYSLERLWADGNMEIVQDNFVAD